MTALQEALTQAGIPFLPACPLARFSTFRIGGNADYGIFPKTAKEMVRALCLCRQYQVPVAVVGNGSNLLFADAGVRGAVLFTKGIKGIFEEPEGFYAECGVLLPALAQRAAARGLSGLEFACGIPGTVGGTVCMNAGAHGGEMAQVVTGTNFYDVQTDLQGTLAGKEHLFGYRTSVYATQPNKILLGAHFQLHPDHREHIQAKMIEHLAFRRRTQPIGEPSAGSVFKRPATGSAAELIDRCGLKGVSVGGAMVSEKHAGFIVNCGGATAKDVLALVSLIQTAVHQKTGILLEPEIRMLGEF